MSRPLNYIKYKTCLNSESRLYIGGREEYIGILPQEDKIVFKSLESPKNGYIVRKVDSSGRINLPLFLLDHYGLRNQTFMFGRETEDSYALDKALLYQCDFISLEHEALGKEIEVNSSAKTKKLDKDFDKTVSSSIRSFFRKKGYETLKFTLVNDPHKTYMVIEPYTEDEHLPHYEDVVYVCGIGCSSFCGTQLEYYMYREQFYKLPKLFKKACLLKGFKECNVHKEGDKIIVVPNVPNCIIDNEEISGTKKVNKISLCSDCVQQKEVFQENIPQLTEMFSLIEELLEENKRLKQALGLA